MPSTPSGSSIPLPQPVSPVPQNATPEPEEDPTVRAGKIKDQGNISFNAKRYGEAIDLYSKAIGLSLFLPFKTKKNEIENCLRKCKNYMALNPRSIRTERHRIWR